MKQHILSFPLINNVKPEFDSSSEFRVYSLTKDTYQKFLEQSHFEFCFTDIDPELVLSISPYVQSVRNLSLCYQLPQPGWNERFSLMNLSVSVPSDVCHLNIANEISLLSSNEGKNVCSVDNVTKCLKSIFGTIGKKVQKQWIADTTCFFVNGNKARLPLLKIADVGTLKQLQIEMKKQLENFEIDINNSFQLQIHVVLSLIPIDPNSILPPFVFFNGECIKFQSNLKISKLPYIVTSPLLSINSSPASRKVINFHSLPLMNINTNNDNNNNNNNNNTFNINNINKNINFEILSTIVSSKNESFADRDGWTPLHYAIIRKNVDLVQNLLFSGSDPNFGDKFGWTPLHLAGFVGNQQILEAILASSKVDILKQNQMGWTVLHIAVFENHSNIIQILSQKAPKLKTLASYSGITPFELKPKQSKLSKNLFKIREFKTEEIKDSKREENLKREQEKPAIDNSSSNKQKQKKKK